jgi:glycosyltransferase involved in cell wall biosynthesis
MIGARARQFVQQNYTWDHIASRLIQVYTDILQQRKEL